MQTEPTNGKATPKRKRKAKAKAKAAPRGRKQTQIAGVISETPTEKRLAEHAAELLAKLEEQNSLKVSTQAVRSSMSLIMQDAGLRSYRYQDGELVKIFTHETIGQLKWRNPKPEDGE